MAVADKAVGVKRAVFVGDLHFYDGSSRSHRDYFENCIDCMQRYSEALEHAKPDYIFLAGDIVGLSERVLRTRVGLSVLIGYLQKWKQLCGGNLYAISGNHDYSKGSALSDFDLLTQLGVLTTAKFVDIGAMRIHLIDYGNENCDIELNETGYNMALMHADLQIEGSTTWYPCTSNSLPLNTMHNLKGISLIFAGHIHNPSPRVCSTSIDGEEVSLVYLGCAARPKRRDDWASIYLGIIDCADTGAVETTLDVVPLKAYNEVFTEKAVQLSVEAESDDVLESEDVVDIELLTRILDELSPYMMNSESDYKTQVRKLAGTDTAAAEMAISYLDKADEMAKVI